MSVWRRLAVLSAICVLASIDAHAADTKPSCSFEQLPPPKEFLTHHTLTIKGTKISYRAIAGEIYLSNLSGEPTASLFTFSYLKDGPPDPKRPVMFVFNGGPGSSSLWLHMGVIGPRKVVLDHAVNPSSVPPFGLEDSADGILDVADLVFVDPVGTGFSRIIGCGKPEDFYGQDQDADSVAQFIELWLSKYGRWNSPKFLMGESYGSVRAAVLPQFLMGGVTKAGVMRGITVNGIVFLGTALGGGHDGAEWSAALGIATMATTAWYHNKTERGGRTVAQVYDEAVTFGETEYHAALAKSAANILSSTERADVATKLARIVGVPAASIGPDLKVPLPQFMTELLADRNLTVGAYDGRYTLPTRTDVDFVGDDPAMGQYVPAFVGAFHQMLRDDLKVEMNRPYGAIVWRTVYDQWKHPQGGPNEESRAPAEDVALAMRRNPRLRAFVAGGYYDIVGPTAVSRHALEAAQIPADRISYKMYESGHMLYIGATAGEFAADVRAFIRSTLQQ